MVETLRLSTAITELLCEFLQTTTLDFDVPLVDYGVDSIRATELLVELEYRFGVSFADNEAACLETARSLSAHLATKLGTSMP